MPITVTVLDTGGIQPFIFSSNVLRENIGASELVHRATRLWAFEELAALEPNHNIDVAAAEEDRVRAMYTGKFAVDGSAAIGVEVLYAGGGNTVALFQGKNHPERAKAFVYRLSRRILRDAPGLNLFAAHHPYTWESDETLPAVVDEAIKELGKLKGRDPGSLPALGFPVTADCTSTGLPANDRHPDTKGKTGSAARANRQVALKWETVDLANDRLRGMFPWIEKALFEWTDNFDDLADLPRRDDNYVAVVHANGNGMGRRIKALTDQWKQPENAANPRGYIETMRELSIRVQETAVNALKATMMALTGHLVRDDWQDPVQHARKNGKDYFPVRPLVFGGDDVTLVCAGPWGLAIARRYLAELKHQTLTAGEEDPPYACAGVAIVKTHYPFSQAYDLSEKLLKGAKTRVRALVGQDKQASALDWHFTTTGLAAELREIRKREYATSTGPLTMRPLMLDTDRSWRSWDNLVLLMEQFDDWHGQRNKLFRLREALRGGPAAVAEFWTIYGDPDLRLPVIDLDPRFSLDHGWAMPEPGHAEAQSRPVQPRCVYFDPIEIADQFFVLTPGEGE